MILDEQRSEEDLDTMIDEEESKDTYLNTKARFIHFVAEYQTVSALCLRASENRSHNERIKELSNEAFELFKESISMLKSYLFPIKSDFDHEVILRITFDTMLMAIILGMLDTHQLNSIEYLLKDIEKNKPLVKKLKDSPYYKITTRIEKLGIKETLDDLSKAHLGHFEMIKNTLIDYFK